MAVAWTLRAKPCGRGSGVVREQNLFLLKLLALSSTELAVTKFTAVSTLAPRCRIRAPPKVLRLLQQILQNKMRLRILFFHTSLDGHL